MKTAACTIISRNYLPYARVLADSLSKHHPECELFVLMVDRPDPRDEAEIFEVINVGQLKIKNLQHLAFRYNVLELNTNVKPTFLAHLFAEKNLEKLVYFDPDILVCGSLDPLFELLGHYCVLLTPHSTSPVEQDGCRPSEVDFLQTGIFNLGFVGLRRSSQTDQFLDWWEKRCIELGYVELRAGLFVDQKWANLVPCYFDSVHVLRDLGCNVAYWNLHERAISQSDGQYLINREYPLRFFHFSGIDPEDDSQLSKHCSRYHLSQRPDLAPLFRDYRQQLFGMGYADFKHCPYGFGVYSDGKPVTQIARSAFAISERHFTDPDPFLTTSDFYQWAHSRGLLSASDTSAEYNYATYAKAAWQVHALNNLLYVLLRVVGPNRYTILMKYLSFISVLRNQVGVLSPDYCEHEQLK